MSFFWHHWTQLVILKRKCTGPKPWILLAEELRSEYFLYIGVTSKTMGPTIFEIAKFPKCPFLTSLDAARRPDAESLICEVWIFLAQDLGPEQGHLKSMGVLGT